MRKSIGVSNKKNKFIFHINKPIVIVPSSLLSRFPPRSFE
jgi:hypothetical protein